tara:strand:+ start:1471 stop:1716 length:246 start_codon:yes stop_codon:yes gene_type:complete
MYRLKRRKNGLAPIFATERDRAATTDFALGLVALHATYTLSPHFRTTVVRAALCCCHFPDCHIYKTQAFYIDRTLFCQSIS